MNGIKGLGLILATLLLAAAPPGARAADTAQAAHRIERFYAVLEDNMKHGTTLGMKGRYQTLVPAVDSTFDLATMIKYITGPNWTTISEGDRRSLTEAFRRMTIANYASNFDVFNGERFDVDPNVQTKGTDAFVKSTLTPLKDKPIPFIYRMRETPDGWKVIDIYLNGYVSELATRRSDFAATLASGGASALAKKINTLADNQLAGQKASEK